MRGHVLALHTLGEELVAAAATLPLLREPWIPVHKTLILDHTLCTITYRDFRCHTLPLNEHGQCFTTRVPLETQM